MEPVGNASFGSEINHLIHHIARTCHTETHIAGTVQYHVGSLYEIFRSLLHGKTSQEGYYLLLALMIWAWNILPLLLQWVYGIVKDNDKILAEETGVAPVSKPVEKLTDGTAKAELKVDDKQTVVESDLDEAAEKFVKEEAVVTAAK